MKRTGLVYESISELEAIRDKLSQQFRLDLISLVNDHYFDIILDAEPTISIPSEMYKFMVGLKVLNDAITNLNTVKYEDEVFSTNRSGTGEASV